MMGMIAPRLAVHALHLSLGKGARAAVGRDGPLQGRMGGGRKGRA